MRNRPTPEGEALRRGHLPAGRMANDAGFTLLETLVALSVACILSIGLIRFMASTHIITGHADRKLAVAALETAVMADLPSAQKLVAFTKSGSRGGLDWEMTSVPLAEHAKKAADTDEALSTVPSTDLGAPDDSPPAPPGAGEADGGSGSTNWRRYLITTSVRIDGMLVDRVRTIRIGRLSGPDGATTP